MCKMDRCFIDKLQSMLDTCEYCFRKRVCNNTKDNKPIDDKECPMRWKKRAK